MAQYQEYPNLSIRRLTSGDIPVGIDFLGIKNHVLGKDYELSLVFPDLHTAELLHLEWKNKPGPATVLSFPLSDTSGEMFISLSKARQVAHTFERSYHNFVAFLFIHGLVHLKGYDHGSTMEGIEAEARQKFGI